MKQSRSTTFFVLIIVSVAIVSEYVNETQPLRFPPTSKDNFPTQLSSFDTSLFLWISVDLNTPSFGWLIFIVTLLGSLSASVILCGFLFLTGQRKAGIVASASIILVTTLVIAFKTIIARPRPFLIVPGAVPLILEGGSSFPSGHTSRVFCLTHLTRGMSRRLVLTGYALASVVSFSRIYLGVHYPLDVLGGMALGLASGTVVHHYEDWLVPKVERVLERLKVVSSNP